MVLENLQILNIVKYKYRYRYLLVVVSFLIRTVPEIIKIIHGRKSWG